MTFRGRVLLEPIPMRNGDRWYRLAEPLEFYSWRLDRVIHVPEGFETDLASIPRWAQVVIEKDGGVLWPALVHDYLYSQDAPAEITRKQADVVFLDAMTLCGMGPIKRGLVSTAVRAFGSRSYRKR